MSVIDLMLFFMSYVNRFNNVAFELDMANLAYSFATLCLGIHTIDVCWFFVFLMVSPSLFVLESNGRISLTVFISYAIDRIK